MYRIFLLLLISSIYSQAILHYPIDEFTEKTPILVEAFIDLPDYEVKNGTFILKKERGVPLSIHNFK